MCVFVCVPLSARASVTMKIETKFIVIIIDARESVFECVSLNVKDI